MSLIQVDGLTRHYGSFVALDNVSFNVEKGEIVGLLGPNGAGKTTAMKVLTGFLQPTAGKVRVGGVDVALRPEAVQNQIGYLPENAPLYTDMSVQDYLVMVAELRCIPESEVLNRISDAVCDTGLQNRLTSYIGELSKGYRQRVGLAQAILHKPDVLILDEPTNGLDPNQILEIRSLIKRLSESATIILSTHILSEVEATCKRAIILMEGQLKADAHLDALTQTSSAFVAVEAGPDTILHALEAIEGVTEVHEVEGEAGFKSYRVSGGKDARLCPLIYDTARTHDWRLGELRPDTKTLESVFQGLSAGKELAA